MNKEIDLIRAEIDAVDEQMLALLETRLRLVDRILEEKQKNRLPVTDAARESRVIAKAQSRANPAFVVEVTAFMRALIEISKRRQEGARQ